MQDRLRSAGVDPLERRLQVVAGKGGVGRTAVSCALAERSALAGVRTLLLEVAAPDAAARMLETRPAVDEPVEVRPNLWLCRMTPEGSMREYALLVLKFKALYHLVFENRLVKYLLRSIPSLAEITMLGKAWYHTTETLPDGRPRYERVIIDAPATGHAIQFLSVARVVADTVPDGVLKAATERMANVIEDPEQSCLHVVSLPEEMSVTEAIELVDAARTRLRMAPGVCFMNRCLPAMFTREEAALIDRLEREVPSDPALLPYVEAARRRQSWEEVQAAFVARFRAEVDAPLCIIPDIGRTTRDAELVSLVRAAIDASARATHGVAP